MRYTSFLPAVGLSTLVLASLSGCGLIPKRTTYGSVYVSHPEVNTRERLVEERLEESKWLRKQLELTDSIKTTFQGFQDTREFTALMAALEVEANPFEGELNRITQDTQVAELNAKLAQAKVAEYQAQQAYLKALSSDAGFGGAPGQGSPPSGGGTPPQGGTSSLETSDGGTPTEGEENGGDGGSGGGGDTTPEEQTQDQISESTDEIKAELKGLQTLLEEAVLPTPSGLEKTEAGAGLLDLFRDKQAYRDAVNAALRRARLDDAHDIKGYALYDLGFDLSVVPGDNSSSFVEVQLELVPPGDTPEQRDDQIRGLFFDWVHSLESGITRQVLREADRLAIGADYLPASDVEWIYGIVNTDLPAVRIDLEHHVETLRNTKCRLESLFADGQAYAFEVLDDGDWAYDDSNVALAIVLRDLFDRGVNYRLLPSLTQWFEAAPTATRSEVISPKTATRAAKLREYPAKVLSKPDDLFEAIETLEAELCSYACSLETLLKDVIEAPKGCSESDGDPENAGAPNKNDRVRGSRGGSQKNRARTERELLAGYPDWLGKLLNPKNEHRSQLIAWLYWSDDFEALSKYVRLEGPEFDGRSLDGGLHAEPVHSAIAVDRLPEAGAALGVSTLPSFLSVSAAGLTRFQRELRRAESSMYALRVQPQELAQNISAVAAREQVLSFMAGLSALIPSIGGGVGASSEYVKRLQDRHSGINRSPLLVGFGQGDQSFGWVAGPKFFIKDGQGDYLHAPVRHTCTAAIVVPAWLQTVGIRARYRWLDRRGRPVGGFRSCFGGGDGDDMIQVGLPMPNSAAADITRSLVSHNISVLGFTYHLSRLLPGIATPSPDDPQYARIGDSLDLLVIGDNLWRSPTVFLEGQQADNVSVLPDMRGLIAHWDKVADFPQLDPDDKKKQVLADLTVSTSQGTAYAMKSVRVLPAKEKKKEDKKAEDSKKVTLDNSTVTKGSDLKIEAPKPKAFYKAEFVVSLASKKQATIDVTEKWDAAGKALTFRVDNLKASGIYTGQLQVTEKKGDKPKDLGKELKFAYFLTAGERGWSIAAPEKKTYVLKHDSTQRIELSLKKSQVELLEFQAKGSKAALDGKQLESVTVQFTQDSDSSKTEKVTGLKLNESADKKRYTVVIDGEHLKSAWTKLQKIHDGGPQDYELQVTLVTKKGAGSADKKDVQTPVADKLNLDVQDKPAN